MIIESIVTLGIRIILFIFAILGSVITARYLGASGKGIYTILISLISVLILFGDLGLSSANIYYTSKKKYNPAILLSNSFIFGLVIGGVLMGIAMIIFHIVPGAFQGVNSSLFCISLVAIPLTLLSSYTNSVIIGLQRIIDSNLLDGITRFIKCSFLIIFLLISPNVKTAVFVFIFSTIFGFVIRFGYLFRKEKNNWSQLEINLKFEVLKKLLSYGTKAQLGNIIQFLNYRLDIFLVNFFINPKAVGIYSVAVTLGESLWYVTNSISFVLFPKVSANKDDSKSSTLTSRSCKFGFYITVIVALSLTFIASHLIHLLFGVQFANAASAFRFLLPGIVAFSITNVLASYIAGRGYPQYNSFVAFISLILTVLLDLILIPKWGIDGAAIATSCSYILSTLITLYFYVKLSSSSLWELFVFTNADIKLSKNIAVTYLNRLKTSMI